MTIKDTPTRQQMIEWLDRYKDNPEKDMDDFYDSMDEMLEAIRSELLVLDNARKQGIAEGIDIVYKCALANKKG